MLLESTIQLRRKILSKILNMFLNFRQVSASILDFLGVTEVDKYDSKNKSIYV